MPNPMPDSELLFTSESVREAAGLSAGVGA
jgi:hypothetical protein